MRRAWIGTFVLVGGLGGCGDSGGSAAQDTDGGSGTDDGIVVDMCQVDGVRNGSESDVDCGGSECPKCADGDACLLNADCESNSCQSDQCTQPNCSDGGQNQDETGIDCGGASCPPCATGVGCNQDADCESQICDGDVCVAPGCEDGIENGGETDLDCGGPMCDPCGDGATCSQNADCGSGYCASNVCTAKSCTEDADCVDLAGPCAMGVCSRSDFQCYPEAINGGMDCDDGDPCTLSTTCSGTRCGDGVPPDCTALDSVCTVGVCNPEDGSCMADAANEGGACDDANPCTNGDACAAGTCVDGDGPDIFLDEDFSDAMGGWSLGTDWEIGPAVASAVDSIGGADPDVDHTATMDNGVAGVLIGGVVSGSGPTKVLESPVVPLGSAPGDLQLRLYRWLSAEVASETYVSIEVYDGANWVVLWENVEAVTVDVAWTEMTFDVTAYKNDQFQIRVVHDGAGNSPEVASWSIDDVRVAPPTCP